MMKTDMPTLVIDNSKVPWLAYIYDGPTLGYVDSLPEAVKLAYDAGTPCGYWIKGTSPQTSLGISSVRYSYQQVAKGRD
jgi:hypothetical protein